MNNGTKIDPQTVVRVRMQTDARAIVKQWTDFMKTEGMGSLMVALNTAQNDAGSLLIGYCDQMLREQGYEIAQLSHHITGMASEKVFAVNLQILIRAKGDTKPRILLG